MGNNKNRKLTDEEFASIDLGLFPYKREHMRIDRRISPLPQNVAWLKKTMTQGCVQVQHGLLLIASYDINCDKFAVAVSESS